MVLMKLDGEMYLVDETLNFEHVPLNFFDKLICGSFKMLPNIANVWFSCKCVMDS
jgi:hypothetical protein